MNLRLTNRRQLVFSIGLGFVSLKLAAGENEDLSAPEATSVSWQELAKQGQIFEHWTPEQDSQWEWYRLERYVDGTWESVGISLPIDRETGEAYEPSDGYLGRDEIPARVLKDELPIVPHDIQQQLAPSQFDPLQAHSRQPDPEIQARDGKPPSDWLRSLTARDLRTWLKTIDAPPASVRGMTFWVHLVRDHSFDPRRIEGLTEQEFLRLHSTAHFGY